MKKNHIKPELFYFIAIFLFLIKSWMFFSKLIVFPHFVDQILKFLIIAMFSMKIFYEKFTRKTILLSTILVVITLIISNKNDFINLFFSFLSIVCAKDISLKKIVKLIFWVNFVFILLHLGLFGFKYITDRGSLDYILYNGVQKRYNCYIRHPNYVAAIILWTLCEYLFVYGKSDKLNLIISITTTILCFEITRSRTTIIAFIILIIYIIFKKYISSKLLTKLFYFCLFGGLILTLFAVLNFNTNNENLSNIIKLIDEGLSHRITYSAKALELFPLTFFGNKIDVDTAWYGSRLMIDSFYISCFVEYGICLLIIFLYSSCKVIKILSKDEKIFLIMVAIVAITERYLFFVALCFPLLYFKYLFVSKRNENEGVV